VKLVETLVPEMTEPDSPPLDLATKTWDDLFGESSVYKNPDPTTKALAAYHHESIHPLSSWEDLETFVYRHYPNTLGARPYNHPDDVWFLEDFQGNLLHCSVNVPEVLGTTLEELREDRKTAKMDRIFESALSATTYYDECRIHLDVEHVREKSFQTGFSMTALMVHATTRELKTTTCMVQVVSFGAQYVLLSRLFNERMLKPDFKLSKEIVAAVESSASQLKPTLPPISCVGDYWETVESYVQQHLPVDMKSAPICFVFSPESGKCTYSRGQKDILGYDDLNLLELGKGIMRTVFLDDQIALMKLHADWMAGILQGTKASSLLQGFPVKRIHKATGARIQMICSAALVKTKGYGEGREGREEGAPFCFIVTETPVTYDALCHRQD
tara:strand:- start:1758 stop:2915 length:1158 start_codon:yes stop_codon:yes gene_type:complete